MILISVIYIDPFVPGFHVTESRPSYNALMDSTVIECSLHVVGSQVQIQTRPDKIRWKEFDPSSHKNLVNYPFLGTIRLK